MVIYIKHTLEIPSYCWVSSRVIDFTLMCIFCFMGRRNVIRTVLHALLSCSWFFSSPRRRGSLRYTPGVGVRTWFKFLLQVLYISYYLSYLHHTCMDDTSWPTYGLEILECYLWIGRTWMVNLGHEFQMLEDVKVSGAG